MDDPREGVVTDQAQHCGRPPADFAPGRERLDSDRFEGDRSVR